MDGNSCAYRAYYAVADRPDRKGQLASAARGLLLLLLRQLKRWDPTHCAVIFEPPAPTVRRRRGQAIAATHPRMAPDLKEQVAAVQPLLEALGIPCVATTTQPAGDVIAGLAREAQRRGVPTVILSHRLSVLQLVGPLVQVVNPHRGDLQYTVEDVVAQFGVQPAQIPDWLALVGDEQEEWPGVPGIGPKSAAAWLAQYGGVAEVLQQVDRVARQHADALRAHQPAIRRTLAAATLDARAAAPMDWEGCRLRAADPRAAIPALLAEGMADLLVEVLPHRAPPDARYRAVLDRATLAEVLKGLRAAPAFALDTETTGVDAMRVALVGISLAWRAGTAYYIPVGHRGAGARLPLADAAPLAPPGSRAVVRPPRAAAAGSQLPLAEVLKALRPILTDPTKQKVGQNVKYDWLILHRLGVDVAPPFFDTMVAAYLCDPSAPRHTLEALAMRYLQHSMMAFEALVPEGKTMADVPIELVTGYACEDADVTWRLAPLLSQQLQRLGVTAWSRQVEMPLVRCLAGVEARGLSVDEGLLRAVIARVEERLAALRRQMEHLVGHPINPDSAAQVRRVLFEELGVQHTHKTRRGMPSTARETLEHLVGRHPVISCLLAYRDLARGHAAALVPLLKARHPDTGRVHPMIHQAATATGRLLVSRPAWPPPSLPADLAPLIPQVFHAPAGAMWLWAEFDSLEWRVLAHLTQDPALLDDLQQGRGPTFPWRDLLGGQHEPWLAEHPGVKSWWQRTVMQAKRQQQVATWGGRHRPMPQINSRNPYVRRAAEREAVATIVEGSCADLLKHGLVALAGEPVVYCGSHMIVLEVPEPEVAATARRVHERLTGSRLPLSVRLTAGPTWAHLAPVSS